MYGDQFQLHLSNTQSGKTSPKALPNNRVPMWLMTGQFTHQVKQEILTGRLPLHHDEEVYLVRYLMDLVKERSDRTQKLLLKKLLMTGRVCQHLRSLPFELVLHFLEVEVRTKNSMIIKAGDYYDRVWMLIEGTVEEVSTFNEVSSIDGLALYGEKELQRTLKAEVTVRCKTDCCFLILKRTNYNAALRKYRFIELKEIEGFFQSVPIVSEFGEEAIKKLAELAQRVVYTTKEHVIQQHEHPQHIWIVVEGQLKSTFMNYYDQECNLVHFGRCDMLGLESILRQPSLLNIICHSEMTICYRIPTEKMIKVLKECVAVGHEQSQSYKQLRQFSEVKLSSYNDMIMKYNGRIGIVRLARVRRNNPDLSKNSQGRNNSYQSSKSSKTHTQGEETRLKTKFFSKNLASAPQKYSSTAFVSETLRSKKNQPKSLYDLYESPERRKSTQPLSPMMEAYRQKLKRNNIQLDIVEKLYRRPRRTRQLSSQHSQPPTRTKQKQTQILMKRIQMTSCRKRRNKQICLFDPQRIVDFACTNPC